MIKAASWRPVLFYPVPFSGKRLFYGLFFFLVTHMDGFAYVRWDNKERLDMNISLYDVVLLKPEKGEAI